MKAKIKRALSKLAPAVIISAAVTFIVMYCVANAVIIKGEKTVNVYDSTIRLRVVANSDSEDDQELKLDVRNDIIALAAEVFKNCDSIEKAKASADKNIEMIRLAAKKSLEKHGSDYDVDVTLNKEKCPVRRYSEFTFPAGEYMTLRVNIGKAKGKNWWCVMYPPLCVSAATNEVYTDKETFLSYGFSESEVEKLLEDTEKPKIEFALLNFIKNMF